MPGTCEPQHCSQRTGRSQLAAPRQQAASFHIQSDHTPQPPCSPYPTRCCPHTVSRLGSWARTGFPFLELPEVTLCQSRPVQLTLCAERARQSLTMPGISNPKTQQLYLKAIIHLALQSRNISWPGSSLLAYVFYLLSPMHHHLAAVSFGAYFSLQTFKLHNIFLLLSRYKKTSSKWRLYKLETTKSRPLVVC